MKSKDENDRLLDGTLPARALDDSEPMEDTAGPRRAVRAITSSLPSDIHAEFALLSALIWCGTHSPLTLSVVMVRDLLDRPEMFFSPAHQAIFTAICTVHERGVPAEVVTVHSELVATDRQRIAGGLEYVDKLASGASRTSESKARAYAQAIRDTWVRRQLIAHAAEVDADARGGKMSATDASTHAVALFDVVAKNSSNSSSFIHVSQCLPDMMRGMMPGRSGAIPTGLRDLDAATGGLFPKEVTVLGARTSVGKSALASQISFFIAESVPGTAVLYISLEMPAASFANRIIAARALVNARKIRRSTANSAELARIAESSNGVTHLPVYFSDAQTMSILGIHACAAKLSAKLQKAGSRIGLIVIDHVGLVKPSIDTSKRNREQQVAETSRGTRYLANEYSCHVMALSQIGRDAEKRVGADKMPKLYDLRESGSLEQDADNVFLLHRETDPKGMFIPNRPASFAVAKARNDDKAFFYMSFDPASVKFGDYEDTI